MQPLDLTQPVHIHPYRIIYGDTDTGGVVYYGNYLRFFEIGRTEYIRSFIKMSYSQLQGQGMLLPAAEAYCRYKAPARYDDLIQIHTSIAEVTKMTIRFHYEIHREHEQRPLARGFTAHTAVDLSGAMRPIPQKFMDSITRLLNEKK